MVANLTRFTACKVDPDKPNHPVRIRKDRTETAGVDHRPRAEQQKLTGDEPVRLFAWVSA